MIIRTGLGILVIAVAARTNRQRAACLAAAAPLALLGFAGFLVAGFA